jgi:hypothetical protein
MALLTEDESVAPNQVRPRITKGRCDGHQLNADARAEGNGYDKKMKL